MILNMAKKRMRIFIIELLKELGPMNTHEIHDILKTKFRQTGSRNEVSTILGRTTGVMKVGYLDETHTKRIRCAIWDYRD